MTPKKMGLTRLFQTTIFLHRTIPGVRTTPFTTPSTTNFRTTSTPHSRNKSKQVKPVSFSCHQSFRATRRAPFYHGNIFLISSLTFLDDNSEDPFDDGSEEEEPVKRPAQGKTSSAKVQSKARKEPQIKTIKKSTDDDPKPKKTSKKSTYIEYS